MPPAALASLETGADATAGCGLPCRHSAGSWGFGLDEAAGRLGLARPAFGARCLAGVAGFGTALIDRTAATQRARASASTRLYLSTYRDVPWNGPFYAKRGFQGGAARKVAARLSATIHDREWPRSPNLGDRSIMRARRLAFRRLGRRHVLPRHGEGAFASSARRPASSRTLVAPRRPHVPLHGNEHLGLGRDQHLLLLGGRASPCPIPCRG